MKYMILRNADVGKLEEAVNVHLGMSWELYEGPFTTEHWPQATSSGRVIFLYHQAMILPEDK